MGRIKEKIDKLHKIFQKPLIKEPVKVTAFFALVIVSLYGRPLTIDRDMYAEIHRFTIRPYKSGLYLTQLPSGLFYNFSPVDAYYTDAEGEEHRLIQPTDNLASKESLFRERNKSFTGKIYSISSYFDIMQPTATFETEDGLIVAQAAATNNHVIFFLSNYSENLIKSNDLTLTLSFNEEDLIFDISGDLYTPNIEEDIREFTSKTGFALIPKDTGTSKIGIKYEEYLFIANKETNGVITIDLNNKAYNDIFINLEKGLIEFDMVSTDNPEITVELYESFEEALNSIKFGAVK